MSRSGSPVLSRRNGRMSCLPGAGVGLDQLFHVIAQRFAYLHQRHQVCDVRVGELMDVCLAENDRRLGIYDPRLLRPTFVPRMIRLARRFMRKPKKATA